MTTQTDARSDRALWRCAVLRAWTPDMGAPLTPVAALAWTANSACFEVELRWVPIITTQDLRDQTPWRDRFGDMPLDEPFDFVIRNILETSRTLDAVICSIPPEAVDLGGAADVLLDQVLTASLSSDLADYWYPTYVPDTSSEVA